MDRRALLDDEQEAFRLAMDGRLSSLWTALPGVVQKVDLAKMTVEVQPAIQGRVQSSNGTISNVNLPLLVDVPIVFPSAGGFTLTLPIKAGDEVLVVFSSRCIDSWWQLGGVGAQLEYRMHDLSDGFAIPGPKSQPKKISSISSTKAQLRNDAGDTYLEIGTGGAIKIKAANVEIEGAVAITGNVNVTGNLTATGTITAPNVAASSGVTVAGAPFSAHKHSGVSTGTGQTGGVV